MKPLITLLTGFIVGALLCAALLLLNPMFDGSPANDSRGSPLALTVAGQGAVTVMQNATGYPWVAPVPAAAVAPLVDGSRSHVAVMLSSTRDADTVAYITRVSTLNRSGRPLFGEVIEHSLWHVVMPGKGSFIVDAEDDLWGFARELAVPMLRGETWRGKLAFETTIGPGRRAQVFGVSGEYAGLTGTATTTQTVREVSTSAGLTDAEATLFVDF